MKNRIKQFLPTSWSIDNRVGIYLFTIMITFLGISSFNSIPKEQFPELVIPTIFVSTVYPGTSPTDMENLITRPIEKQIKSINGVKKITSNSLQDFSSVVVEFNTNEDVAEAKQKVKDAVDKAKSQLPNNLPKEPSVMEVDFSEFPIMYINISGDYDLDRLKRYAESVQDRIESLKEITRCDIVGALEREIQINVDMYKIQAAQITFADIERAIAYENMTISGGSIKVDKMTRDIRVVGQFPNTEMIKNIIVKNTASSPLYLKDIAEVVDGFKEQESYARLDNKNVITINVIKKSGENLISASDQIKAILADMEKNDFPKDLKVTLTGDQSKFTKTTLNDLNNTIVMGFIFVTVVLMFFMGFTNALFVGLSVPLSMAIAYSIMPGIGFSMNMIVMFAFIFVLGIVVDDAIVVIENTHRIFHSGNMSIVKAAKIAAGEVFMPVFAGTLTTIAPFLPLAFWPGIVGKFMYYMPVTVLIALLASLFVAYIMNPVFAVSFMRKDQNELNLKKTNYRLVAIVSVIVSLLSIPFYLGGINWMGNFLLLNLGVFILFRIFIARFIAKFQLVVVPKLIRKYEKLLRFFIRGNNPYKLFGTVLGLFIFTIILTGIVKPKVIFFPKNEPNQIYIYLNLPIGTHQTVTDSLTKEVQEKVYQVIGRNNPIVESVITNIALGAGDPYERGQSITSQKGRIAINFVESIKRNGIKTSIYLDQLREVVKEIPGAEITVDQNRNGPPTGKPVNIELSSEDLDDLVQASIHLKNYLDSLRIGGIEELKTDFLNNKPEIIINVDRERANREGISTAQVGSEIRTAIFGKEVSKYKEGEDDYPIQLRFAENQRKDIDRVLNLKITYRDMATGLVRQIPLSSVASVSYNNTYGSIKRKNLKRVITLQSNILSNYTTNDVLAKINDALINFPKKDNVEISMTGEREDMKDAMSFLGKALFLAIGFIFLILIIQFNSLSKSLIILSQTVFSIIGVLLGFIFFNMQISIIMTGMGIVALAGIVVKNGILLVEFTDEMKKRGLKTRKAIVEGCKTRIVPVLLTASSTIIGLIPLAIGLNFDFITMITELNPHMHFGGDNAAFWGNLSWTIIFGLTFASFLTLVVVPSMYFIAYVMKLKSTKRKIERKIRKGTYINIEKLDAQEVEVF